MSLQKKTYERQPKSFYLRKKDDDPLNRNLFVRLFNPNANYSSQLFFNKKRSIYFLRICGILDRVISSDTFARLN